MAPTTLGLSVSVLMLALLSLEAKPALALPDLLGRLLRLEVLAEHPLAEDVFLFDPADTDELRIVRAGEDYAHADEEDREDDDEKLVHAKPPFIILITGF